MLNCPGKVRKYFCPPLFTELEPSALGSFYLTESDNWAGLERLGSLEFMNILCLQLWVGPNVHVVHRANIDSSLQDLYSITLAPATSFFLFHRERCQARRACHNSICQNIKCNRRSFKVERGNNLFTAIHKKMTSNFYSISLLFVKVFNFA